MRFTRREIAGNALFGTVLFGLGQGAGAQSDPLPSWNEGPAKRAIVRFV